MNILYLVILFVIGYLLGSINMSVIVSRHVGKCDITKVGSGNAGGTNVARTIGAKWGVLVIVIEIVKSTAFGLIARYVFPADILGWGECGALFSGLIAVLGCFVGNRLPCFNRFKGGKGVTVGAALAIVIDWRVFLALISLFLIIFLITHIVSISSIIADIGIPVAAAILYAGRPYGIYPVIVSALISAGIVLNHLPNIRRILNGTENRFEFGKGKRK